MDKAIIAAGNDLYAQYSENPEWDDAKDVVEDLDVERLLAAADAARVVTDKEVWDVMHAYISPGAIQAIMTDIHAAGLKVVRA